MTLDALAKSRMKAAHRAEREVMADRHRDERQQLTHMNETARKRETEEARKRTTGHAVVRVKSADENVRDRVKAHQDLKSRQDKEYRDLNARHSKEEADAERSGRLPARHTMTPEGKKVDQTGMTARERSDYQGIVRHYSNRHAKKFNEDEGKKDRYARYKSSAMTARLEQERLSGHDDILNQGERALANRRLRVESRKAVA
jgi:hypothetical protein